ncbi:hypothetical protein IT568_05980 [bacterium]|nr:hypothetical protein [bacterium]
MAKKINYVAEIKNVKEVTLLGTANANFWQKLLENTNLTLDLTPDGKAQILIISAELKFKGVRFREVSYSLLISHKNNILKGSYLIYAFSSDRFFAFCERTFFSTPYFFEKVNLATSFPFFIQVGNIFQAKMLEKREILQEGENGFEGAVFLPEKDKFFFAKISGYTRIFPFLKTDFIEFNTKNSILRDLLSSNFEPKKWITRENAFHSKSATYQKTKFF